MVDICCKNTLMKCTVACSMSWLLNRIETGVDLVLLQTLFSPGSFLLKSQGIEHTTVQWLNTGWKSFLDEQCQGSCHNFLFSNLVYYCKQF